MNSQSRSARPASEGGELRRGRDPGDPRALDRSAGGWRESLENYRSPARLAAELQLMRSYPTAFCPSAALPEVGSYVARQAAGTPLIAVRGADGSVCVLRDAGEQPGARGVSGLGAARGFACPSYGWSGGLEGRLRDLPHGGDCARHAPAAPRFAPVYAVEHGGLVFVTQELPSRAKAGVDELLAIIPPGERIYAITEEEVAANWKILAEGFIAGYHVRATHRDARGPDEPGGQSLVGTSGASRRMACVLTYAYHLFPNVMVVMLPDLIAMIALEPVAADRTRVVTYALCARGEREVGAAEVARAKQLLDAGAAEDRALALTMQRGLAGGASAYVEFDGDGAIAHFHRTLHAMLDR